MSAHNTSSPFQEAILAMQMKSIGINPAWTLSDKAQKYTELAYGEFSKALSAKSTDDCQDIAENIYKIIKDFNEDQQQEQQSDGGEGEDDSEDSDKDKDGSGDNSSNKSSKTKDKKDKKDSDKKDKKDSDKKDKKDSDKKDKKDSDKKDKKDSDKKDSESENEEGNGGEDEEENEADEGEDKGGNGSDGEADDDDEDEDSGQSNGGDEDADDNAESSKSKAKASKSGGDQNADGNVEGGDDSDDDMTNDDKADSPNKKHKTKAEIEQELAKAIEKMLDEEVAGKNKEDFHNDMLERELNEVGKDRDLYLSDKMNDQHVQPPIDDSTESTFATLRDKLSPDIAAMVWALKQAIRSMAKVRKLPYQRSGKIDDRRLVQIAKNISKEVFKKTRNGVDISVAVEIIIDESGSMGGDRSSGARNLAIVIGETLDQLGIPFEITGTTTMYGEGSPAMPHLNGMSRTNPVIYKHYKVFADAWHVCKTAVSAITSHLHNIDGEAIEYAAIRLSQRKESRKIIFSICDGQPCGGQRNDEVLAQNIIDVCHRARKSGIEVYGFGVETDRPEQYYDKKFFVLMPSADRMGQDFIRKFADTITAGRVKV
jgi:cobalamin biosynthesis protein CobT